MEEKRQQLINTEEDSFTYDELEMIYLALCDHGQTQSFTKEGKGFYDNLYSKVNRKLGYISSLSNQSKLKNNK